MPTSASASASKLSAGEANTRKSNTNKAAVHRQLLRVLAVAFGFALFGIQRSTQIDAADGHSSLYEGVQHYTHWMLSASSSGGVTVRGSATLSEPDIHYVHESYLIDDNADNGGDGAEQKPGNSGYASKVQQMEQSLQERISNARGNSSVARPMILQSCRRRQRQRGESTEGSSLNSGAHVNSTYRRTLYHVDGLAGCRHMLLPPAQQAQKVNGQDRTFGNNSTNTIIIYNPHPSHSRIICGEIIGPDNTLELIMEEVHSNNPRLVECLERNEPSRLYETIPSPHNAMELPPVRIRNKQGRDHANFVQFGLECDMNCQEEKGRTGLVAQRYIDGTDWKFQFSMEGSTYYPQIAIQPNAHRQNQFYATTSFRSEVPVAYFSWDEYNISKPAVEYDHAIKGASFLARNCASRNNREALVKEMMQWRGESNASFRVDALSRCLHNAEPQKGWDLTNKVDIMRRYLFHLSLENSNEEDYITEKLWGALESGSVPVYFGAPNAKDHAPHHSIILANEFKDGGELAAYLAKVAQNRTLYESYHAWRKKPLVLDEKFVRKYNHTHTHSICRFCRWSYARRYGLGFDHESQTVQETKLSRKACLDKGGSLSMPIIEKWQDEGDRSSSWFGFSRDDNYQKCSNKNINNENRRMQFGKGRLKRAIWEHDGVIDLHIDPVAFFRKDALFNLDLFIPNGEEDGWGTWSVGRFPHREKAWIQNNESRVTVLTRPKIQSLLVYPRTDSSPTRIALTIPSNSLPLRIRILVDDVDTFHAGAEQEETYFAKKMEADFHQPLEFFKNS